MEYKKAKKEYLEAKNKEAKKVLEFIAKNGIRKSAKLLKLSVAYVYDIKNGARQISDNVISKLERTTDAPQSNPLQHSN